MMIKIGGCKHAWMCGVYCLKNRPRRPPHAGLQVRSLPSRQDQGTLQLLVAVSKVLSPKAGESARASRLGSIARKVVAQKTRRNERLSGQGMLCLQGGHPATVSEGTKRLIQLD